MLCSYCAAFVDPHQRVPPHQVAPPVDPRQQFDGQATHCGVALRRRPDDRRRRRTIQVGGPALNQADDLRRDLGGPEVADDVPDVTGIGMASATLDTPIVSVQAGYLGDAAAMQLTGEFTVAAAEVECASSAVWDGIEHHGLVPGTHGSEA